MNSNWSFVALHLHQATDSKMEESNPKKCQSQYLGTDLVHDNTGIFMLLLIPAPEYKGSVLGTPRVRLSTDLR